MVNRKTRIFFNNKFFDYPLKPLNALFNLGFFRSVLCVFSYMKYRVFPLKNKENFETWVINRFGKELYEIFFKSYSEKLWGIKCDKLDIDVWDLIKLAKRHPRVDILKPGPGVGGHCIAVDPWFIVDSAPEETPLIQASRYVNDNKPAWIVQKILNSVDDNATVSCLGLTYKSDIDDLRESPSIKIVERLSQHHKGQILVADPNIESLPDKLCKILNIEFCNFEDAISRSRIIVLLTDHREFIEIDKSTLINKKVFDTRGIWRSFLTSNNLESIGD